MPTITWEIPLTDYPMVAGWIAEASDLSQTGPQDKLEELVERIRRYPGYPVARGPEDVVVVVPKDSRIWISAADPIGGLTP